MPYDELSQYINLWDETPYTGKSYQPHPTPRSAYAAMISFMDKQIGRLLDKLDELGIADNTVVFFTSDNGTTMLKDQVDYEFFESVANLRGLKGEIYEGGIRVPFLVRWPGRVKAGSTSDHISAHYDALATIADIVAIKPEQKHDGISYLPTLLGKDQRQHEYLFWDFGGYGGRVAMRRGEWKAVLKNLQKNPDAELELYNLGKDPSEKNNLAREYPDKVIHFLEAMVAARDEPEVERFRFWRYD